MRLTPWERSTIRDTVRTVAGSGARVRLFGSRTDDSARSGDIDLLVGRSARTPGNTELPQETLCQ